MTFRSRYDPASSISVVHGQQALAGGEAPSTGDPAVGRPRLLLDLGCVHRRAQR